MTVRTRVLIAVPLLVLIAACSGGGGTPTSPTTTGGGGSTPTAPAANQVLATLGNVFDPMSLTVTKGTEVSYTFAKTHNVTFSPTTGAPTNIGNTSTGTVTRTFATAGTFNYVCTLHSGMTGTVVVN